MNDLRKLSRRDLLEMLLELRKENDNLRRQLDRAREELASRELVVADAGNLAEAVLRLNGVFEAAQKTCDQYMENVRQRIDRQERETSEMCAKMLAEARKQAENGTEAISEVSEEK